MVGVYDTLAEMFCAGLCMDTHGNGRWERGH